MPHVGQTVIYRSSDHGNEPLCALVAAVLDENKVNLTVFAKDGSYAGGHGAVLFVQAGDPPPKDQTYCTPVNVGSMNASEAEDGAGTVAEVEPIKKPSTHAAKKK